MSILKPAVIYLRASSQEQSTQEQLELCKKRAEEQGYDIIQVYNDQGHSSLNNRPAYTEMIDFLNKNKDIIVITTEASRISRDTQEIAEFLNKYDLRTGEKLEKPVIDHLIANINNDFNN